MSLPTVYEFKYKPEGEDKKTFLLGTSVGGKLNFYLYNDFSNDSVDLSFKCKNYKLETTGPLSCTTGDAMTLTSSGAIELTSSGTMTLSAEKVQASTSQIGTPFSFTSTASTSDPLWVGGAEFGKSQDARVRLGCMYSVKTNKYEPWIVGYNSLGKRDNLYLVPGSNSYVYLGNPSSSKGAVARIGSSKLEVNRGTTAESWKEVAVKDDIPTPSYKYHLTTLWINVGAAFKLQDISGVTTATPCGYSKIVIMPAHAYLDFEPDHGGVASLQQIITNEHLHYGSLCYLVEGSTHTMGVITAHSHGDVVSAKHSSYGSITGVSFTVTTTSGSSVSILAQDIKDRKYQKIRVN